MGKDGRGRMKSWRPNRLIKRPAPSSPPPPLFISQLLRWIERGSRFIEVEFGHTQKVPPTTATSPCDYSAVQQNF